MSDARIEAALRGVFAADSVLIDYAASMLEDQMPQSAEAMIELLAEKIVECELCTNTATSLIDNRRLNSPSMILHCSRSRAQFRRRRRRCFGARAVYAPVCRADCQRCRLGRRRVVVVAVRLLLWRRGGPCAARAGRPPVDRDRGVQGQCRSQCGWRLWRSGRPALGRIEWRQQWERRGRDGTLVADAARGRGRPQLDARAASDTRFGTRAGVASRASRCRPWAHWCVVF
jgi:hypothetical protein